MTGALLSLGSSTWRSGTSPAAAVCTSCPAARPLRPARSGHCGLYCGRVWAGGLAPATLCFRTRQPTCASNLFQQGSLVPRPQRDVWGGHPRRVCRRGTHGPRGVAKPTTNNKAVHRRARRFLTRLYHWIRAVVPLLHVLQRCRAAGNGRDGVVVGCQRVHVRLVSTQVAGDKARCRGARCGTWGGSYKYKDLAAAASRHTEGVLCAVLRGSSKV